MAKGLQRLLRRAVLAKLKGDAPLTALVPATSIYGQAVPSSRPWPFIKLGPPLTLRLRQSCVDGGVITLDVHAFAYARKSGAQTVETAEDHASRIGEAIETALQDNRIDLGGGITARIRLSDMQLLQDDEPEAFHYLAQINARVLA
ncbi:MAG: DUF3168 domain-containing protein [Blastomonas sp.]